MKTDSTAATSAANAPARPSAAQTISEIAAETVRAFSEKRPTARNDGIAVPPVPGSSPRHDIDPEALGGAWRQICDMEEDLMKVRSFLRVLQLSIDGDSVPDDRDSEAFLNLIWTTESALSRISEARGRAFHLMHPMIYGTNARCTTEGGNHV